MTTFLVPLLFAALAASAFSAKQTAPPPSLNKENYYGTPLGKLAENHHDVSGEMYAVDEATIFIRDFNYDGAGPDAYFWAGDSKAPDAKGFIIPDEKGSTRPLGAYRNKNLVLRLPEGKTLRDITWISIWCRKFSANFGDLQVAHNLQMPAPVEIAPLSQLEHGVKSGPVTIIDAQTFLITDFHYDGQGPAGFWWVTAGPRQGPKGLRLKDENNSPNPLRAYSGETVVITLPDEMTVWDFDWLGVWCQEFNVDFGSSRIPNSVLVPPSPRMLGVRPEVRPAQSFPAGDNSPPTRVAPARPLNSARPSGIIPAFRAEPAPAPIPRFDDYDQVPVAPTRPVTPAPTQAPRPRGQLPAAVSNTAVPVFGRRLSGGITRAPRNNN